MAIVQGIREKVHLPIYDSLSVEAKATEICGDHQHLEVLRECSR